MPQNITDAITYTSPIVSVADGDAASGANFLTAPQGLANRTAFLNNILNTTGVTLFRSATVAGMQALTGVTAGSVCLVASAGTGVLQGLYFYFSAATLGTLTPDNKFVYAATGMGAGNWVHELYSLYNANSGVAAIGPVPGLSGGASGRLLASVVPNRIFATPFMFSAAAQTTTSATYVDIPGTTVTVNGCLTNDIVLIHGHIRGKTSAGNARFVLAVDDGSTHYDTGSYFQTASTVDTAVPVNTQMFVTANCNLVIKLGFRDFSAGGNTVTFQDGGFTGLVIRP